MIKRKLLMVVVVLGLITMFFNGFAADDNYDINLRDADVKSALRMLAMLGNINIVMPEKLDGKVTATFEDISVQDAMSSILKTNGFGAVKERDVMRVVTKEELTALGEDLVSHTYDLQFGKAMTALPQVQSLLSNRGSAIADDRTNSIHVRDIPAAIANITGLISGIDKIDRQILIEAKIIDASTDFIRSLGIQWGVTKTGGSVQTSGLTAVGTDQAGRSLMFNAPAVGYNSGPPLSGVGLILGSFRGVLTDVQLSASEQKGDIDILARPSVSTLNNIPASIRSGEKFYVRTNGNITIGGSGGSTTAATGNSNLQEIDTGIELKVTPQISGSGFIKLDIDATQSEADFTRSIEGVPAVLDNTASTTVMLQSGETTIIGGLFKMKDVKQVRGTPGLMKIPLLGNLFKSKTRGKTKSELLIFITPTVIENPVKSLASFQEPESSFNPNPPVALPPKPRKNINKYSR